MSVKLNWQNQPVVRTLYFSDLSVNECFRNVNGRGAVYRKVQANSDVKTPQTYYMMEEATGKLFHATISPVERVNVEVNLSVSKPYIY